MSKATDVKDILKTNSLLTVKEATRLADGKCAAPDCDMPNVPGWTTCRWESCEALVDVEALSDE